jgi:hypothetical protein
MVKNENMKQVVRASRFARDTGALGGWLSWPGGYTLEWSSTVIELKQDDDILICGPIGEFADLQIEERNP